MKWPFSPLAAVLVVSLLFAAPACAKPEKAPEKLNYDIFGQVLIYRDTADPGRTVLLLSDKGWDARMDRAARSIAAMGAAVVGVDTAHLLAPLRAKADGCLYEAWVFEGLSKIVQKTLGFKRYRKPVLAGFGEGATVAYATLAQAPVNTFSGAIPLGFSPKLAVGKPLCEAYELKLDQTPEGIVLHPAKDPQGPIVFLQGRDDAQFPTAKARAFAAAIPGASVRELASAPKPDAPDGWSKDFRAALDAMAPLGTSGTPAAAANPDDLSDLPLVEVPAKHPSKYLAVIVTGDGGWAGIDAAIGGIFADHGVSVIGINSLKYFWNAKKPDETARDLERVLTHYGRAWNTDRFIVVGYSIGADVMPFMAGRLSEAAKAKLAVVAMLGPGTHADFEFHLSNWLTNENVPEGVPMVPEMPKLAKVPVLLFCGSEETGTLCQNYKAPNVKGIVVPGGHHFNEAYTNIAKTILRTAGADNATADAAADK